MSAVRVCLSKGLPRMRIEYALGLGRQFSFRAVNRNESPAIIAGTLQTTARAIHYGHWRNTSIKHSGSVCAQLHSTTTIFDKTKNSDNQSFQPLTFGDQTAERSTITKALAMRRYLLNEESLSRIKPFRPAWRTPDGEALYLLQVVASFTACPVTRNRYSEFISQLEDDVYL